MSETRQIDDVIRKMAVKVGEIHGWRDSVNNRLDGIDEKLSTQNGRIDDLETFEDETKASRKTTTKWVSGMVILFGFLFTAFRIWG